MIPIIRLNDYPFERLSDYSFIRLNDYPKKHNIVITTIQRKIANFAPNFTNTQSYGIKIKIQGR